MKALDSTRRAWIRRITSISTAMSVLTVLGVILATPPASASTDTQILESHGSYDVQAPSDTLNSAVVEIKESTVYWTVLPGTTAHQYEFRISPNLCLAANSAGTWAVLHQCGGGYGTYWIATAGPDGHSCVFESRQFPGHYLSGRNTGTQLSLQKDRQPGYYQQFKLAGVTGCGS